MSLDPIQGDYIPRKGLIPHFDFRQPVQSADGAVIIPQAVLPYDFGYPGGTDNGSVTLPAAYMSFVEWMKTVSDFIEGLKQAMIQAELKESEMSSLLFFALGQSRQFQGLGNTIVAWLDGVNTYVTDRQTTYTAVVDAQNYYNAVLGGTYDGAAAAYESIYPYLALDWNPINPSVPENPVPDRSKVDALVSFLESQPDPRTDVVASGAPPGLLLEWDTPSNPNTLLDPTQLVTIWQEAVKKAAWLELKEAWRVFDKHVTGVQFDLLADIKGAFNIVKDDIPGNEELYFYYLPPDNIGENLNDAKTEVTSYMAGYALTDPTQDGGTGLWTYDNTWTAPVLPLPAGDPFPYLSFDPSTSYLTSRLNFFVDEGASSELAATLGAIISYLETHLTDAKIEKFFNLIVRSEAINLPTSFYTKFPGIQAAGTSTGTFSASAASLQIGLDSNYLEILLSSALLKVISANASFPPSGRLFASLQFTTWELMAGSALLAAIPGAAMIVNLLASGSTTQFSIALAIAATFANTISGLVGQNEMRYIVNGNIQGLYTEVRRTYGIAAKKVIDAETALVAAKAAGDPALIAQTTNALVEARIRLEGIQPLYNAFNAASVGSLAALSRGLVSTLNLSMLTIALAFFGRSLGLPGIVPQLFANFAGLPLSEILDAMASGSTVLDLMKSRAGQGYLKETLIARLKALGIDTQTANPLINNTIRNLSLRTDLTSLEDFLSSLEAELLKLGLTPTQASVLTLAANDLVQPGQGIWFLNLAYNADFNTATVAGAIASNLAGFIDSIVPGGDQGALAGILRETVERAKAQGGYATQGEFRDQLAQELEAAGLSAENALVVASNVVAYNLDINPLLATGPAPILDRGALAGQLRAYLIDTLTPTVGEAAAETLKNEILLALFGSDSVDEIAKEEFRNPLSIFNQIQEQLTELWKKEDEKTIEKVKEQLGNLLKTLMLPNAEVAYLIQSLGDHPTTFISNIAMALARKRDVDIPV